MSAPKKVQRCSSDPSAYLDGNGGFSEDPFHESRAKSAEYLRCDEKFTPPEDQPRLTNWAFPVARVQSPTIIRRTKPKPKSLFEDKPSGRWLGGGFKVESDMDMHTHLMTKLESVNMWAIYFTHRLLDTGLSYALISVDSAILTRRFVWRLLAYTNLGKLLKQMKFEECEQHMAVVACAAVSLVHEVVDADSFKEVDFKDCQNVFWKSLALDDFNQCVLEITHACNAVFVPMDAYEETPLNFYNHACGVLKIPTHATVAQVITAQQEMTCWSAPPKALGVLDFTSFRMFWTYWIKNYVANLESDTPLGKAARTCHLFWNGIAPRFTGKNGQKTHPDEPVDMLAVRAKAWVERVSTDEDANLKNKTQLARAANLMRPFDMWLERKVIRTPRGMLKHVLREASVSPMEKSADLHFQRILDAIKTGELRKAHDAAEEAKTKSQTVFFKPPKPSERFKATMRVLAARQKAELEARKSLHQAQEAKKHERQKLKRKGIPGIHLTPQVLA